ncbi:O-antigen ligase family protein [Marinobacter sp. ANT_B65]|uniref:O-antigen ligase family protein n=1 Tax=Marinobacter sp. ANT_B65 TaxID=2039467 RepID=UPI000BBE41E6|nr:O-antigen ligase family protein [Marinobacter sp. ANT_B65]PCM42811.1 hypothetical protein CPA50_18930 [Marinobacter sp. ANT_B65]
MTSVAPTSTFRAWLSLKSRAEMLFIAALVTYIFCYLPVLAAYRGAESVMILTFIWLVFISGRKTGLRSRVIHDPLFLSCTVMLGFLGLARLWYSYTLPPGIDPGIRETRYFLKPAMVFLVALGMGVLARPYRWHLLLLSMSGLATYLLTTVGTGYWTQAWEGKRTDFGIHNAQHTAMFLGTALIAMVCFTSRLVKTCPPRGLRTVALALVVITFAIAAFVFISTQTRAAWLGILTGGTIGVATTACLIWKKKDSAHDQRNSKPVFILVLLLLFGTVLASLSTSERIKESYNSQTLSLGQYITLDSSPPDPQTSHGIRLLSWRVALEWLKERPLVGWGPGSVKDLIDQSSFFSDGFKHNFGHMHNSLVESLVANGLTGTSILLSMIIWLGIATFIAHRRGRMPDDVFIFALSFFGFWTLINLFESYVLYTTGHYINAVFGGFIYSFYLQPQDEEASNLMGCHN